MGIFKKNLSHSEANVKFAGAYLPLLINEYLTLHSLATGVSKQKILINLVTEFKERSEVEQPLNKLIEQIVAKGVENWKAERKKLGYSKGKFFIQMHKELLKMGITSKNCLAIIENIKNEES